MYDRIGKVRRPGDAGVAFGGRVGAGLRTAGGRV